MKKRAWLSLGLVVLIALTGVLGSLLMTTRQPLPDYHLMLDAARRMERGPRPSGRKKPAWASLSIRRRTGICLG